MPQPASSTASELRSPRTATATIVPRLLARLAPRRTHQQQLESEVRDKERKMHFYEFWRAAARLIKKE
jgi:hypothetical protein